MRDRNGGHGGPAEVVVRDQEAAGDAIERNDLAAYAAQIRSRRRLHLARDGEVIGQVVRL